MSFLLQNIYQSLLLILFILQSRGVLNHLLLFFYHVALLVIHLAQGPLYPLQEFLRAYDFIRDCL